MNKANYSKDLKNINNNFKKNLNASQNKKSFANTNKNTNKNVISQNTKKKKHNPNYVKKYRKSIVEAMDFEKTAKYGFDTAYFIFERSINRLQKEGDEAEKMAFDYLKEKGLLSETYALNKIIALNNIKIEADIIDYGNKIIYETKSRRTGKLAKTAVIKKWKVFEFDKKHSNYEDYDFKGIIVANYADGKKVKAVIDFDNKTFDDYKIKEDFNRFYEKLEQLQKIKSPKK